MMAAAMHVNRAAFFRLSVAKAAAKPAVKDPAAMQFKMSIFHTSPQWPYGNHVATCSIRNAYARKKIHADRLMVRFRSSVLDAPLLTRRSNTRAIDIPEENRKSGAARPPKNWLKSHHSVF